MSAATGTATRGNDGDMKSAPAISSGEQTAPASSTYEQRAPANGCNARTAVKTSGKRTTAATTSSSIQPMAAAPTIAAHSTVPPPSLHICTIPLTTAYSHSIVNTAASSLTTAAIDKLRARESLSAASR